MRYRVIIVVLALLVTLVPQASRADGTPSGGWDHFGKSPKVSVEVTSTPTGVYIQISVDQTVPGSSGPTPIPSGAPKPTPAPQGPPSGGPTATPSASGGRWWSDATGIYEQTPDGHVYYLTVPNMSNAIDWKTELQSHPDQMPFALYVDNQFLQIIWVSTGPSVSQIIFGPPPGATPIPGSPPAGNGSSTDPYQVALNLLDHVPLPNIQIKMNPSLGLVNLPGWFWVAGYDGKPFGTSQTVTVPPAVGPDVPITQVPANDPGRQPTYFTVSVQVWPTSYQWGFGDGATLATQSLGQAYPVQSDIQHTYQYSSLQTPGGFPVQVTVVFAAQFQVNGGGAQGLPSMAHTYASTYPVQEAQALLTSH